MGKSLLHLFSECWVPSLYEALCQGPEGKRIKARTSPFFHGAEVTGGTETPHYLYNEGLIINGVKTPEKKTIFFWEYGTEAPDLDWEAVGGGESEGWRDVPSWKDRHGAVNEAAFRWRQPSRECKEVESTDRTQGQRDARRGAGGEAGGGRGARAQIL